MMIIMPVSSAPERHDPSQAPGEIISRVRVDSLYLAQTHPYQHGDQMDVLCEIAQDEWWGDRAKTE